MVKNANGSARNLVVAAVTTCLLFAAACGSLPDPTATAIPQPTTGSIRGISTDVFAQSEIEAGANPTEPPTSQSDIAPALTPTPRPSQHLNVIVPPCVPYPGSGVDPCSRRDTWEYHNPFRAVSFVIPDVFWTLRDLVIITDSPTSAPQFIVRAIVIPGSIRCGNAEFELKMISSYNDGWSESLQRGDSHCFVDIAVNEYLLGGGPNRLTVNTRVQPCRISGEEPACGADRWKVGVDSLRATGIEGVEWIFSLGGPRDLGALAWDIVGRWDVQLREDGEVVVVSRLKQTVLRSSSPENFDVNLSRVEQTLDDFRSIVKDAHRDLVEMTQGRITTRNDVRDQPAARMALDAGPTGLSDFIFSTTSIERLNATPTSPPPVPGENDPNPAGLTVNDIIATRVAGGIAIPGGLEDTATPVSALGDEPTATATEEAEPTATSTVEPTVTPEPAPTPEPEATPTPDAEVAPTGTPEPVPTPEPEPTATATPEPVVDPTDTPTPEPEPTATNTPEPVVEPTATNTPEPAIEPTATPEDAIATDTPEPEVPGPEGPGAVGGEGGEGGPDGSGPDG